MCRPQARASTDEERAKTAHCVSPSRADQARGSWRFRQAAAAARMTGRISWQRSIPAPQSPA